MQVDPPITIVSMREADASQLQMCFRKCSQTRRPVLNNVYRLSHGHRFYHNGLSHLNRAMHVQQKDTDMSIRFVTGSFIDRQMEVLKEELKKIENISSVSRTSTFSYLKRKDALGTADLGFGMSEQRARTTMERSIRMRMKLSARSMPIISQNKTTPGGSGGAGGGGGGDQAQCWTARSDWNDSVTQATTQLPSAVRTPQMSSPRARSVRFNPEEKKLQPVDKEATLLWPSTSRHTLLSLRHNPAYQLSSALTIRSILTKNQTVQNEQFQRKAVGDDRFTSLMKTLQPFKSLPIK